ncbi:MAG: peptidoglycan DD-metalloendopeptidase family protein, partial [bacterium]|nr:peptidoglycan DD-metalloendopeptidase family protein [bacterium]
ALKRVRYLSRIAEQDRQDYEAIRVSRKRVDNVLQLQQTQHEHQRALLKAKQVSEQRLSEHVTQREKELRRLRVDASARRREIQKTEAALAESSERIAQMIQELQRRKQLTELPPFDFPGHRGKLRKPVAGKVVERFGRRQEPELKTWTFHRGVNLAAPEGKDVVAVAPGEVVMVDWFPGYGQFVLLRHPGGFFTLYGHLASVQVNRSQLLAEGATLGQVGSTGRVDGVPQLHFEIMEGEQPLDPMGWIK